MPEEEEKKPDYKPTPLSTGIERLRQEIWRNITFTDPEGDMKGLYSVRVGYHYRLVFSIEKDLLKVTEVITIEELTNHYQ